MDSLFIEVFGKPHGIVIYQLLAATKYTIYLSLVAFIGGGLLASIITLCSISRRSSLEVIAKIYIWSFQSIPLLMLLFLTDSLLVQSPSLFFFFNSSIY